MTDIKKYTNHIRTAIYGKEVRESLATGIEVINAEVENNTAHVNKTVTDIEQFKSDIDSAERQRMSNENTRIANEETRKEEFKNIVDKNGTWDKKLSDLYNTNNSSLDSLNNNLNALHKSFQSKYDNLEKEYAQEITDVKNTQGQPNANYKIDSLGIHSSSNGFIDNLKLFGKTVFNIIPLNPSKWVIGGSGEKLGSNAYYSIYLSDLLIKPNTTYSYKIFGLPQKYNCHWFHLTAPQIVKSTEGTFTSLSEIGNSFLHLYPSGDQKFTLDDVKNVKIVLVEGNVKIDNYFEGLKSVGDDVKNIEINTCNLNAFNENLLSSRLEADGYYHFRTSGNNKCSLFMGFVDESYKQITDMTPNSVLDLSKFDLSNWKFLIGINGDVKDDKVLIPVEQIGYLNTTFFKGCEFVKVDNNHIKVKNIELSFNKTISSYVPHEESKKNLLYYDPLLKAWNKPILRKWDTIEKHSNGKYYYHKRSKSKTLTGKDSWATANQSIQVEGYFTASVNLSDYLVNLGEGTLVCDKYKTDIDRLYMGEGIYNRDSYNGYGSIALRLSNKKGLDLSSFKDYLNRFPFTVVYKLEEEKVYECLDISTMAFSPTTMLSINSGPIRPEVDAYMPNSLISSVKGITSKLKSTDKEVTTLVKQFSDTSVSEPLSTDSSNIIEVAKGLYSEGEGYKTKDYRNSMKRGIVSIDDVVGQTVVRNRKLWNVSLDNIASYDPSTEVNIFTKQPKNISNCSHTLDNSAQRLSVRSTDTSYGFVQFEIDVRSNTTYMFATDFEEDDGNAFIAIATTPDGDSANVLADVTYQGNNSAIFTTFSSTFKIYIRFYANVNNPISGLDVTYRNAKLVQVKDFVQNSGLKLRSLPNGVHDRIKNGKKIRRIKSYTLNGSENWELIDQSKPNTNAFACKLPDSINNPDKKSICLNNNAYTSVSDDTLYNSDSICLSIGGVNGQLIFRVGKWCTSVEKLIEHLADKETDITIEYEITKRTMEEESKNYDVDVSVLCESGDKILIGSPVEIIESTHRVPLSTKSQIDNLQDSISKTKRSVWSKLKDLLNVEYESTPSYGYLKLPKLFGGFILQWGWVEMGTSQYNYLIKDTFYPINFPQSCYYVGMGYMRSDNSWQDLSGNATGSGYGGTKGVRLHIRNTTGNQLTGNVSASWFAIGR